MIDNERDSNTELSFANSKNAFVYNFYVTVINTTAYTVYLKPILRYKYIMPITGYDRNQ